MRNQYCWLFLFFLTVNCVRRCAFFSSHFLLVKASRPVVVHVDLRYPFSKLDPYKHQGRQFTLVRVNNQDLVCGDISTAATRLLSHNVDDKPQNEINASTVTHHQWSDFRFSWTLESQTLRHIVQAKTAWLADQCFVSKKTTDPYWIFDICIGNGRSWLERETYSTVLSIAGVAWRFIGQFHRDDTDLLGSFSNDYNALGFYDPYRDEVYANGTVVQHYTGGKDGRSVRLIMTCGTDTTRKISSIVEGASLQYSITLEAPAFCDWRHGQSSPMSNLDLLPSRLLQELQGWCTNYTTNGWWTYEYCYPDSLIQFHLEHSTAVAEGAKSIVLVGALYGSPSASFGPFNDDHGTSQEQKKGLQPPTPSPSFPLLRSPYIRLSEPGEPIKWPSLPLEFTDFPGGLVSSAGSVEHVSSVLGGPLQSLFMELQPGAFCGMVGGVQRYRKARLHFYCPHDFLRYPQPRITQLREIGLCVYEAHIATALVCAHPTLLPELKPLPETVLCYPANESLSLNASVSKEKEVLLANVSLPLSDVIEDGPFITQKATPKTRVTEEETIPLALRKLILDNSPEYIPSYTLLKRLATSETRQPGFERLDDSPKGSFGTGFYIRKRNLDVSPRFVLGQIVRHHRLNVAGVVFGWDPTCRVPEQRLEELSLIYTPVVLTIPHYLIRLFPHPPAPLSQKHGYLYSPEVALEPYNLLDLSLLNGTTDVVAELELWLSDVFGEYNRSSQSFSLRNSLISLDKSPIFAPYPIVLPNVYPDETNLTRQPSIDFSFSAPNVSRFEASDAHDNDTENKAEPSIVPSLKHPQLSLQGGGLLDYNSGKDISQAKELPHSLSTEIDENEGNDEQDYVVD